MENLQDELLKIYTILNLAIARRRCREADILGLLLITPDIFDQLARMETAIMMPDLVTLTSEFFRKNFQEHRCKDPRIATLILARWAGEILDYVFGDLGDRCSRNACSSILKSALIIEDFEDGEIEIRSAVFEMNLQYLIE